MRTNSGLIDLSIEIDLILGDLLSFYVGFIDCTTVRSVSVDTDAVKQITQEGFPDEPKRGLIIITHFLNLSIRQEATN